MATIIKEKEIQLILKNIDLVKAMEEAFIQYSNGNSVVPPVGELLFNNPDGEAHIKYGYIKGEEYYVVKIASGFYENPKLNIASSQGVVLLFSQTTGELKAVLLDNGKLTDIRTAAAGALVATRFAPKKLKGIGIAGTGIQARLQLKLLLDVIDCNQIWVWGRDQKKAKILASEFNRIKKVKVAKSTQELSRKTNYIVTTTSSNSPLLKAEDILPGTHITAVGSDTAHKQELDTEILKKADLVVVDSLSQSEERGEVFKALSEGIIAKKDVTELGVALQNTELQRTSEDQITVADLTGVAVQDMAIGKAIYENYNLT
ncbi:MAG: hypothetical protein JJ971_15455 [Balneolaceae bacterium]|nr:hypothetical protein [Balneolaceae bacterium]MBO6547797.1 hypothetical protein [Balneolaceae bacterium]MBO6648308.1 hypothetical protein [Balneolaceae bacterium]